VSTLRKLVFGETWTLPIAVAAAIGLAALVRAVAGGWWRSGGGFVLLVLVAVAYVAATWTRRARRSAAVTARVRAEGEPAGESA
jgi:membrane protein implicated in regulation of membrane protease activity